jgi:hypothetical protein
MFACFLYCNHQMNRDFLIILYIPKFRMNIPHDFGRKATQRKSGVFCRLTRRKIKNKTSDQCDGNALGLCPEVPDSDLHLAYLTNIHDLYHCFFRNPFQFADCQVSSDIGCTVWNTDPAGKQQSTNSSAILHHSCFPETPKWSQGPFFLPFSGCLLFFTGGKAVGNCTLLWNPQGNRKRGRPKNSWRRSVIKEAGGS